MVSHDKEVRELSNLGDECVTHMNTEVILDDAAGFKEEKKVTLVFKSPMNNRGWQEAQWWQQQVELENVYLEVVSLKKHISYKGVGTIVW